MDGGTRAVAANRWHARFEKATWTALDSLLTQLVAASSSADAWPAASALTAFNANLAPDERRTRRGQGIARARVSQRRRDAGDSGNDVLARPSERAGCHRPSRRKVTLAADTAHVLGPQSRQANLLATVLPRRAIRIGVASLVDTAGRSGTGGERSRCRVGREADAVEHGAHPLQRVAPIHALAVELTVVVARYVARAPRILRDVRIGGRAGRSGAVGGRIGASVSAAAKHDGGGYSQKNRVRTELHAHISVLKQPACRAITGDIACRLWGAECIRGELLKLGIRVNADDLYAPRVLVGARRNAAGLLRERSGPCMSLGLSPFAAAASSGERSRTRSLLERELSLRIHCSPCTFG
jgi:hypothetical protein